MRYTRREVIQLAAASLPAAGFLRSPLLGRGADGPGGAGSAFGGVRVGVIAPYSFRGLGNNPEDLLKAIVKLGLSAVELQSEGFEQWAGAPEGGFGGPPGGGRSGRGGRGGRGGPPGPGAFEGFPGNLPGLKEGQASAVRELNESLSARSQTLAAARTALSQATFASAPEAAGIKSKAEAVAAAELDLAQARADAFAKLQASTNKLSNQQVESLVQQGAGG